MKKEKMPTDDETVARMAAIVAEGLPDSIDAVYESAAAVEDAIADILSRDGDSMAGIWAEAARVDHYASLLAAGLQPPRPIGARRAGYGRDNLR